MGRGMASVGMGRGMASVGVGVGMANIEPCVSDVVLPP